MSKNYYQFSPNSYRDLSYRPYPTLNPKPKAGFADVLLLFHWSPAGSFRLSSAYVPPLYRAKHTWVIGGTNAGHTWNISPGATAGKDGCPSISKFPNAADVKKYPGSKGVYVAGYCRFLPDIAAPRGLRGKGGEGEK